jgi:hypothetical protein
VTEGARQEVRCCKSTTQIVYHKVNLLSNIQMLYNRSHLRTLQARLDEPPKFMIVVAGPRQIGKSTMVRQALDGRPSTFEATDQSATVTVDPFSDEASTILGEPGAKATEKWIIDKWTQARAKARSLPRGQCHVLAQFVSQWAR